MPSGTILLAEDDPKLRKLYTDALSAAGYNVLAAKNGFEALELLNKLTPSVIILDVMMPKMSGIETCRRMRNRLNQRIPILFLTSLDRVENVHQCLEAGGDDYLIKSSSIKELLERVGHWATRPSLQAHDLRREKALTEVELAIAGAKTAGSEDRVLSSDTDAAVRDISGVITRSMKLTAPDFGQTLAQKLYLLGYVVGIVENWAKNRSVLKLRFNDYLFAVLEETEVLVSGEAKMMIDSLENFSSNSIFRDAHARGQFDATEIVRRGTDFITRSLADFDERLQSEAAEQLASTLRQT